MRHSSKLALFALLLAFQLLPACASASRPLGFGFPHHRGGVVGGGVVGTITSGVSYDTAIGTGVGTDGFAALPLYNPGTDGTDVAAGAPTMDAGACTYTGASRTVTCTATGPMFRWPAAATIGQTYHVRFNTHLTTYAHLIIKDENGTVEWTDAFAGNGTSKDILSDGSFVATGHDIILDRTDDAFAGTIQVVGINQNTGGIPGRRFYINASTGNDTRDGTAGQSASTPFAHASRAVQFVQNGRGDQIVYAQGISPGETFPNLINFGGVSPAYPFVVQTYDTTDATNEAKMGRTGAGRPLFSAWNALAFGASDPATKYHAIRGVEFNPGNVADACFSATRGSDLNTPDYLLLENDVFAYTCINLAFGDLPFARAHHIIVRNSSLYGEWGAGIGDHAQGLYGENIDGMTAEDNVFWHNGWNVSVNRTDSPNIGGATIFNHPIYGQMDTVNTVVRRNVFIDTSTDGAELKGGGIYQKNLSLINPIGVVMGHNSDVYTVLSPYGVWNDTSYNAILGSDGSQNWGIWSAGEARPGSLAHHNVVSKSAAAGYALMADAGADTYGVTLPNYITYDSNRTYQWGLSQATCLSSGGVCTFIHATYTNNLWDDATSGSNTHTTGVFPNAYTSTTIATALGYADLTAARTDFVAHPDQHKWEQGVALALTGYGITTPATMDLSTDLRITAGIENYGQFIGAQDGSTLSATGLPGCVTIDGSTRTWRATTACTVSSATVNVTETPASGSPHTTVLSLNIYARPVLSSLTVTPSTTTATASVSPNVGSGTLFWAVLPSATTAPTSWEFIRSNNGATVKGNQAISATGSQSITGITGLTHAVSYVLYAAQLDANNNPSVVSSYPFTTSFMPLFGIAWRRRRRRKVANDNDQSAVREAA